ncbi:MAG: shikimate kinase [Verrucomicrobiae bacterium]|nr:shikimate kinase [Verrucomicrobiae bacterium]
MTEKTTETSASQEQTGTGGSGGNVVLIGFMGTGKTSVGRRVADSLGFRFVDTDQLVVELAGKPITKIFAEEGEAHFRELETEALRRCASESGQVIATGGGIVTQPRNRELLHRTGYVVWLKADPETVLQRVSRNRDRPLLQTADPLATIQELYASRVDLYRACADEEINTSDLTLDETAHGLTESARIALASRRRS